MFGSIIDSSCRLWEKLCDVHGSCWVYDNLDMSKKLFALTLVLKVISIAFNVAGWLVYKAPPAIRIVDGDAEAMVALNKQNVNNSSNSVASISTTSTLTTSDQSKAS